MQSVRERREHEEGFTLIELMMVVLIIAILISIAIPTFLGAGSKARKRAAQSTLRNGLTAAKVSYSDIDNFSKSTDADLPAIEPSLTYVAAGVASTGPNNLSVAVSNVVAVPPDSQVWAAASKTDDGKCYWIKDVAVGAGGGTFFGPPDPTAATCTGTAALAAAGASW
jgi:type IV pilus assembly protein PilA